MSIVNIRSLDFDEFLSIFGVLDDSYGRYKSKDTIHLGKNGIRKLAMLIKSAILYPGRDARDYASVVRDEAGRSSYVSS